MAGLKYEKNPATKATIQARVEGYMKRAEDLKEVVEKERAAAQNRGRKGGGEGGTATRQPGEDEKEEEDKNKLKGALASSIVTDKPNVRWEDVAGLEAAKEALKEAVILPVRFPQLFVGKRKPWRGILLYGPPGTGKSFLAKAVATEADCKFFSVSSSDLVSKWQGESERLVRSLFEMAREEGRAIIFIDEVDSLCGQRTEGEADSVRRIKTEFLVQMDGVGKADPSKQILVLGATNIPWELDPAIRRRFEKRVYIPLPEPVARAVIFKLNLGDTPHNLTADDFNLLAEMTDGCSGADISICVREALMEPLRKCKQAKYFVTNAQGMLTPYHSGTGEDPNVPPCPRCPMVLLTEGGEKQGPLTCQSCGAVRGGLYEIESERLLVPDIEFADFEKAAQRAKPSVAPEELDHFTEWTTEFGQEG
uniref:Vacuolar protein-sorting-associated protein 4 n=2 Tax=Nannochloropsis gaditana TaxID=72520 RepID=I2CP71_NANGC